MAFEAMFLYKGGIVLQEPVYDTIVAAQLTLKTDYEFRNLHDSGLKTLVPALSGVELPTFEEVVDGHYFDELDPDDWNTCRYACADSDWALQLYHTFNNWFEHNIPAHRFICEKIESPTTVFTGMMKYNGVQFDTDLMQRKKNEALDRLAELREKILLVTGDIEIGENCGTQDFKNFLYKTLGLPVVKTTEKYQEAADDEAVAIHLQCSFVPEPIAVSAFLVLLFDSCCRCLFCAACVALCNLCHLEFLELIICELSLCQCPQFFVSLHCAFCCHP